MPQNEVVRNIEAQVIVNRLQKDIDALAKAGASCSVIFSWEGLTHTLTGCAGSSFGPRVELSPASQAKVMAAHMAKDPIRSKLDKAVGEIQEEVEKVRAVLSAIWTFAQGEASTMCDIEKLAVIGRCSSESIEEVVGELRETLNETA